MEQLTLFAAEVPANPSASRACEKAWMTQGETSSSAILPLLISIAPGGSYTKMSLEFCHPTEDGTLVPSSGRWGNSGMGSPTECLTLSLSEHATSQGLSPSADAVCSLSDILETGDVPQRYYLPAKACAGILRRAAKRGKDLPPQLAHALQAVAGSEPISTSTED